MDRYWTDRPYRARIDAENAHCRAVDMADALDTIGRTPTQDWLLSDKLDEQLKRFKAEVAAERAMFTDEYGIYL